MVWYRVVMVPAVPSAHCVGIARFAHARPAEQQRQRPHQGAGEKDRSPAEAFDQRAGEQGTEGETDPEGRAEHAEGAGSRMALEFLGERSGPAG